MKSEFFWGKKNLLRKLSRSFFPKKKKKKPLQTQKGLKHICFKVKGLLTEFLKFSTLCLKWDVSAKNFDFSKPQSPISPKHFLTPSSSKPQNPNLTRNSIFWLVEPKIQENVSCCCSKKQKPSEACNGFEKLLLFQLSYTLFIHYSSSNQNLPFGCESQFSLFYSSFVQFLFPCYCTGIFMYVPSECFCNFFGVFIKFLD